MYKRCGYERVFQIIFRSIAAELSLTKWEDVSASIVKKFYRFYPVKRHVTVLNKVEREADSRSEREVQPMQAITKEQASPLRNTDEELIDTLIAISVVAKRLAQKLRQETREEKPSE